MSENIRSKQFKSLILHSIIKEVNTKKHVPYEFVNLFCKKKKILQKLNNPKIFPAYRNFENIKGEWTSYLVKLRFAYAISRLKIVLHNGTCCT